MKVYLDNNASTPVAPEVMKTVAETLQYYGNPSSLHEFGMKARTIMEKARTSVSNLLAVKPEEIVFSSGGTESNNLAIQGALKAARGNHIITSEIEHHAVLNVFKMLEKQGYRVSWIRPDEYGMIDPAAVAGELCEDTALVSIMLANNETGTVQPVEEISGTVREFSEKVVIHTDAVQALGKMKLDLKALGVDMASFSAHKVNGPKGTGALYVRKGVRIKPLMYGGHHERGLRPGTENVAGIAGFGPAVSLACSSIEENCSRLAVLRSRLLEGFQDNIDNIKVNGHPDKVLPNTLNISFKNVEGESIVMMLDMEGIAVSTGSACSSESLETSHVLSAMRVDPVYAQGSIRFSLGHYTTEEEIDYVIEKVPGIIERLRNMSPLK